MGTGERSFFPLRNLRQLALAFCQPLRNRLVSESFGLAQAALPKPKTTEQVLGLAQQELNAMHMAEQPVYFLIHPRA